MRTFKHTHIHTHTHTHAYTHPHTPQLISRLFGVDVVPADGKAQVWHPDVRFFEVRTANRTPVAYVYVDPFSRPAEKRSGAWMDSVLSRCRASRICRSRRSSIIFS